MVPILIICLLKTKVLAPVTLPRLRLADSAPAAIVAPAMSVVTWIAVVSLGSSLNEIAAAWAGVIPTTQSAMSVSGTNSCFVFISSLLRVHDTV
jgi:hypothetical protein